MDVIELGSYTREEKFHIAKEHLVPKQLKKHGIKPQVRFANDAIYSIIDFYTKEAGVRKLERNIAKICRMTLKSSHRVRPRKSISRLRILKAISVQENTRAKLFQSRMKSVL